MNEPIEKLFEQALEEFKAENKYATVVVPDPLQKDFVGKFARLIVSECLDIVEDEDDGSADTKSVRWAMIRIKKHFGVEE